MAWRPGHFGNTLTSFRARWAVRTASVLVFAFLSLLTATGTPKTWEPSDQRFPARLDQQLADNFVGAVGNLQRLPVTARRTRWQVSFKHPAVGTSPSHLFLVLREYPRTETSGANRAHISATPRRGRAPPTS